MEPLINILYDSKSFLKCSHRGGLGLYPENTLYAFSCSVKKNNIDMIELDLQFTRDQKVVVLHDNSIDRTTNGKGAISDLNYNEVLIYDAGYNFYDNEEGYIYRGKGIKGGLFFLLDKSDRETSVTVFETSDSECGKEIRGI